MPTPREPPSTDAAASDTPSELAVRRALRALIDGTAPTDPSTVPSSQRSAPRSRLPPETIVEEAHEALAEVGTAAEFVADGGLDRLRNAIAAAEQAGDRDLARSGQRPLAWLERYRRAASGDHFHPGRGTVFRPDGQSTLE